jgi:hypothetical protein
VGAGRPVIGHAEDPPSGGTATVTPTLPNAASYGPSRRGDWRIDADVPQSQLTWEDHDVHTLVEPAPPPPAVPYLRYAAHPYAHGTPGYVLRGSVAADERLPGRLHAGQVSLEGGYTGRGRGTVGVALRFVFWRLGFDSNVTFRFAGRIHPEGPPRTALIVGSTNGLFAPILRPKATWWVGGGINYGAQPPAPNSDRPPVGVGPNLTSTVDLFVVRPLVFSVRGDLGTLGTVPMMAGRGTIGFILKSFELYAGYEARRLGDVLFQGPMIGARAWF